MVKKDQMGSFDKVRISREEVQEVGKLNYLRVMMRKDDVGMDEEVGHRTREGRKFWGTMVKL